MIRFDSEMKNAALARPVLCRTVRHSARHLLCSRKENELDCLISFFVIPHAQIYNFLVMYAISIIMTEAICGGLKNVTGRPRPCFFELCGYPSSVENGTRIFGTIGVVADISKCTNKVGFVRLVSS